MHRFTALTLVAIAELLAMGLWFGVSAVAPQIAAEWRLDASTTSWLTLAVQLGFVAGTLLSATLNLPDVIRPHTLFALCALLGAIANVLLAWVVDSVGVAIALRVLTGMFLAGVYPPGMKIIATWFKSGRGFALGVLVGALTLGKASPYLVNALGSESWRVNAAFASIGAVLASLIVIRFVGEGPYALPNQPFDPTQITRVFANRGVRLANFGYFGHMWELYAMWAWVPVMIRASVEASGDSPRFAEVASFLVIGAGAIGCVVAGLLADRVGRPVIAAAAMAASGACCLVVGFLYGKAPLALLAVAVIWGATVVADSAQFSACVTEYADPRYIGTALTLQTCIGFLITTVSIRMMPLLVARFGWEWAFAFLAPGPLLGIIAMMRLTRVSDPTSRSPQSSTPGRSGP
ncbi:MAG TPA: MFS transporter [Thermoanaerobaculia bacterium]|nr:MFS transporter [Thermoanaerobaculia bacterium]